MKNILKKLLNPHPLRRWFKENKKMAWAILILVLIVLFFAGKSGDEAVKETKERSVKIEAIDLQAYRENARSVKASGEVEALEQVELKSEATGRITRVNVSVGDTVRRGQVLLSVNGGSLGGQLQQARADLESIKATRIQLEAALDAQLANLAEIERGPKPEEVALAQTQVDQAKQTLANHYGDVKTVLKDAHSNIIEIVYQNIDSFFSNPRTNDPALTFGTSDQLVKQQVQGARRRIETMLPQWQSELDLLTAITPQAQLDAALVDGTQKINEVRSFLDKMTTAVLGITGVGDSTQTTYLSTLDGLRATVNSTLTTIDNQQQTIASQKLTVQQTEDSLTLTKAGNSDELIKVQEAAVAQAEAQLLSNSAAIKRAQGAIYSISAELGKTVVRSPISGIVSTLEPRAGEFLTAGSLVANVVNTKGLQVKAYIDSNDLWMVTKGARVKINERFDGEVINVAPSIDPATKKVEVRIAISTEDVEATLPVVGQFVNVVIISSVSDDGEDIVIKLPLQAIHTEGTSAFVFSTNEEGKVEKHLVELGNLSGVEVEIKSDLSELNKILSSVRGISVGDKVELTTK